MLTRKTLLAIAATAAIGASALGTTEASAWGFHGFRYHYHFGYHYHWAFHRYGYHWGTRWYRPWHYSSYRPYTWRYRWIGYHRPFIYGAVGAGAAAAPISAGIVQQPMPQSVQQPAQVPGNCLVKQYLQNGSVVFQDICTQETAVAPAAGGGMMQTRGPAGPAGQ